MKKFFSLLCALCIATVCLSAVACVGEQNSSESSSIPDSSGTEQTAMVQYVVEYYFESETQAGVYVQNEEMTFRNTTTVGTLLKPDQIALPQYELNVEKSSSTQATLPTEGITFQFYYQIKICTVSFEVSAEGTAIEEQVVRYGEKAEKPNNPKHSDEEAVFKGWLTENGTAYDFNTPVTDDIILIADWEIPQYGPIV